MPESSEDESSEDDKIAKKAGKKADKNKLDDTPLVHRELQQKRLINDNSENTFENTTVPATFHPQANSTSVSQQASTSQASTSQGSTSQASTSQSSDTYAKAVERWRGKSELALDFIYNSDKDEIVELNDMDQKHPFLPLKLTFDPNFNQKELLERSKDADEKNYTTRIHDKFLFRDRLRQHPEKYILTALNEQQIKIISKHYKNIDGLEKGLMFLQIVQVKYCEDDANEFDDNPEKMFQPITGT